MTLDTNNTPAAMKAGQHVRRMMDAAAVPSAEQRARALQHVDMRGRIAPGHRGTSDTSSFDAIAARTRSRLGRQKPSAS